MTQRILEDLYYFNHESENWALKDYAAGTKQKAGDQWGGGRARRLLGLAYTIAFTCLLRVDEVLKIQSQDLILLPDNKLQLTLPFRKTNQFGGVFNCVPTSKNADLSFTPQDIKPFVLHEFPEEMEHLNPVLAYAEWQEVAEISSGYIFRRLASGDRISENNQPMVSILFDRTNSFCTLLTSHNINLLVLGSRILLGDVPQQSDRHRH
jgi:hypothetical protein